MSNPFAGKNPYPLSRERGSHCYKCPEWKGKKDVTEYVIAWWLVEDLFLGYSEKAEGIDFSRFAPMSASDISWNTLPLHRAWWYIKTIVFLGMLSAFTKDSQFNILLNAPSSSGKSLSHRGKQNFPEESVSKHNMYPPKCLPFTRKERMIRLKIADIYTSIEKYLFLSISHDLISWQDFDLCYRMMRRYWSNKIYG